MRTCVGSGLLIALLLVVSMCCSTNAVVGRNGSGASTSTMSTTLAASATGVSTTSAATRMVLDLGSDIRMELAYIPSGQFMMGAPKDDKDASQNERPQHELAISDSFYMGVCPVTQKQYAQVMGSNPSHFQSDDNPVEMVSWSDAVKFCERLSRRTGRTIRLPTEAEWEYACRARTRTRFYYGDDLTYAELSNYAWYKIDSNSHTHPVGQKKPNNWGLYDMVGNVKQWCYDKPIVYFTVRYNCVHELPYIAVRGSYYVNDARECRSASRDFRDSDDKAPFVGFRVIVTGSVHEPSSSSP